ncbi:MAG: hypothetical protein KatS3mg015_2950 [Fimbriimonadales bacterium]|nr:MAG: hypothetical protein KatS3mg015_2950 [Fimbriimonadales bacterium]
MSDPTDTVAAIVKYDQEIQERARSFVMRLLDEAERLYMRANPEMKASLLRMWLPSLIREITRKEEDDGLDKVRDEMRTMIREMMDDESAAGVAEVVDLGSNNSASRQV